MTDALRAMGVRARGHLLAERDGLGLVAFRALFGLLGFVSAIRFLHYGWVDAFFVNPRFFFRFAFAPFVEPLGTGGMHAVFWIIAASSLLVAVGLFYRAAIATFFVAFTYVQLVDVTNYLNHYYLVSILALLMTAMPLGEVGSIDAWRRGRRRATLPGWCWTVLRFQVGVVYTFAGIAKLSPDWLVHAQPLDIWLSSRAGMPIVGPVLALPWMPHAMSWGGCLYDLTITGWLLATRTRPYAFAVVIAFHAMVGLLFPIGMFPYIMVACATVFFDPAWPRRFLGRASAIAIEPARGAPAGPWFAPAAALFAVFAAIQILVPLRTFAQSGNVLWDEHGMRFSWRVMVREKNAVVTYLVEDPRTGRTIEVAPRAYLDARQEREFATQPDLVLQLGKQVGRDWEERTGGPVRVRAEVLASLNGRRTRHLVDPAVDLTKLEDAGGDWILPAPVDAPPFLHGNRWRRASAQR